MNDPTILQYSSRIANLVSDLGMIFLVPNHGLIFANRRGAENAGRGDCRAMKFPSPADLQASHLSS